MSTINSIVANGNMPLLIIALGFILAGVSMLSVAAFTSYKTREASEE